MPRYLERQFNTWHVVVYIPKDVQPYFRKTKFTQTLQTDSRSEAEVLKLPYVAEWKALIKAARNNRGPVSLQAIADEVRLLRDEIKTKWKGFEDEAIMELAYNLRDNPDQDYAEELLSRVQGDWTPTEGFIEDWIAQAEFQPKTADEARANLTLFCDKFRFFETVGKEDLEGWVDELRSSLSVPTVKKKVGHVRGYWQFCVDKKHTKAPPPPQGLVKAPKRSKALVAEEMRSKRKSWTVEDYHKLLAARPDDTVLNDLIRLGAHTGMRREELCAMKLEQVKSDRFVVEDAKSAAGWREIPIHSDIKQLVARLFDESTDGYLLPDLTANKYGHRGSVIGHRFSRLKTSLGYPKNFVFHSFRKTLTSMMRDAGIPESQAALIVGHDLDTMTYGLYGNDISFARKAEIMASVSYRL
ncbi:MAG: tyrosine-type recombinase/integrase [Aestuariivita sp.]|uniref:tyrosine-type recombinase/integrase n=1 Tax=Aestuariivita sp. TaxID=1872407 RepID=UPI003BAFD367